MFPENKRTSENRLDIYTRMRIELRRAMSNPISEEEFNEISEVFRKVKKSFIKRGYYSKTNLAKEESALIRSYLK
jgi:hypothetical protein